VDDRDAAHVATDRGQAFSSPHLCRRVAFTPQFSLLQLGIAFPADLAEPMQPIPDEVTPTAPPSQPASAAASAAKVLSWDELVPRDARRTRLRFSVRRAANDGDEPQSLAKYAELAQRRSSHSLVLALRARGAGGM
jgi:hypothetical protein